MSGFRPESTRSRHSASAPLVGRSDELDHLRQWLTEALGGSPRVVVMTGEAGIGKSRLVAELIAEARAAGVRPFAGRSLEDSRLPLLPVAAMLDALLPDLARYGTVGAIRSDDAGTAPELVADVGRALMEAAVDRPLLLVLEDAQWADQATIELVSHIAATLAHEAVFRQLPAMLLVTARSSGTPVAVQRLLTRLGRETIARALELRGLDVLGVYGMLAARSSAPPSVSLVNLASDATSGNPHEIDMLMARLEQAGALEKRDHEVIATVRDVSALPLDIDADVEEQLRALPESARQLVTTLALLRDGRIHVLRVAANLSEEQVDAALDAATVAGVLADDGNRVDFVVQSMQRAVVRGMTARRRQRAHDEIARRLAAVDDGTIAVTEIVDQLHRAGSEGDVALLAKYARAAGDEALARGAWRDATRHFEAALRTADLDDSERAALELRAALAAHRDTDSHAAADHASRSIEIARRAGDLRAWGDAALLRSRAAWVTEPLEEFLDAAGDSEPGLRAQAHATLSELVFERFDRDAARAHAERAQQICEAIDDPRVVARVEFGIGLQELGSLQFDSADAHFSRCSQLAHRADDRVTESWGIGRRALVAWCRGWLPVAVGLAATAADRNRAYGLWSEYALATTTRAGIAFAQGNLGAAERFALEATSAHGRAKRRGQAAMLWSTMASFRTLQGDVDGAHAVLDEWEETDARPVFLYRALVDAVAGQFDAPRGRWQPAALMRSGVHVDLTTLSVAAIAVELADALQRPEVAEHAGDVLARAYALGARFIAGWCSFVPRLVGVAHLLAGETAEAETWLQTALLDARRSGAEGEVARVSYDLARTLLTRDASRPASESLEASILGFESLGYLPLLREARRLAGRPDDTSVAAPRTRVILVTDLVDSTPLTQRVGDRRFVELLREHNRIVRTRLRQFDGVEFKHTGDGIAASFLTAGAAIGCGLRVQEDLERSNAGRAGDPLFVRIGISAGEVLNEANDLFGLAVVMAFRVCDHAKDGGVLVSEEVTPLARGAFAFSPVGDVALKGITGPRRLFEVAPNHP